jgi:DNA-directed RNA polymerase specialized sigma24 family protein
MSRTNRATVRRTRYIDRVHAEELEFHPELLPADEPLTDAQNHRVLEAVLRAHRWQLVAAARPRLGNDRREAEDLVHDLCVEVLEGRLPLPSEPAEALRLLVGEIIDRCADGSR